MDPPPPDPPPPIDGTGPQTFTDYPFLPPPDIDLAFNPLSSFADFLDIDSVFHLEPHSRPIKPLPPSASTTTLATLPSAKGMFEGPASSIEGDGFMGGKKRATLASSAGTESPVFTFRDSHGSKESVREISRKPSAEEDEEEKKRGGPRFLDGVVGAQSYSYQIGGGYDDHDCDDSFTMSTSLPKKRKIPINSATASLDQTAGPNRLSRASTTAPSNAVAPEDDVESYLPSPSTAPNIHGAYYFDFPSFPYLPRGYTRQIPPLPPKVRTSLQITRLSPACRAHMWAKTVWGQRKKILALALGVEGIDADGMPIPSDEPTTLTREEERAVEYSGVVWGKVFDAPSLVKGGKDVLKEGQDGRRKKQEKLEQASSGMNGIKEVLTKDGLSITSIVREEIVWSKKKPKPLGDLANFKFSYQCDSAATTFLYTINRNLVSLRKRLTTLITRSKLFSSKGKKGGKLVRGSKKTASNPTARSLKPPIISSSSRDQKLLSANDPNLLAEFRIDVATHKVKEMIAAPKPIDKATVSRKTLVRPSPTQRLSKVEPELLATNPVKPSEIASSDGSQKSETIVPVQPPGGPPLSSKKKSGKKKRSALANAGNPHHMKNYVPTRRLSDQANAHSSGNASFMSSLLFPPSSRFLSARPNRYRSSTYPPTGEEAGSEEYICMFCDYSLFYGSSESSKKAVSKRKKMLARRKRARERASGVANGLAPKSNDRSHDDEDWDCDDELLPNGQCRRCAERRTKELRIQQRAKKKKERDRDKEADHRCDGTKA